MIEKGKKAPAFTLPDQDGNHVKLADFAGKPVVLYFYPRADTPGCTTQACGVRDHRKDYASAGAVVLGVSPDPVAKVKRFHDKFDLGFTLLADEDHAVCERYGTWAEKSMYGKNVLGCAPGHVRDRRRRQGRHCLPEGLTEDPRRAGSGRAGERPRLSGPRLETERLSGSPAGLEHLGTARELFGNPAVTEWIWPGELGGPRTPDQVAEIMDRQMAAWRTEGFGWWWWQTHDGEPVGEVGLQRTFVGGRLVVEVGWTLLPRHWGTWLRRRSRGRRRGVRLRAGGPERDPRSHPAPQRALSRGDGPARHGARRAGRTRGPDPRGTATRPPPAAGTAGP